MIEKTNWWQASNVKSTVRLLPLCQCRTCSSSSHWTRSETRQRHCWCPLEKIEYSPDIHLNVTADLFIAHSDKNKCFKVAERRSSYSGVTTYLLGFGLLCSRSIFIWVSWVFSLYLFLLQHITSMSFISDHSQQCNVLAARVLYMMQHQVWGKTTWDEEVKGFFRTFAAASPW